MILAGQSILGKFVFEGETMVWKEITDAAF
jgi:hypothetical protein